MQHELTISEGDDLHVRFERFPGLVLGVTYRAALEAALQVELNRLRSQDLSASAGQYSPALQQNVGFGALNSLR